MRAVMTEWMEGRPYHYSLPDCPKSAGGHLGKIHFTLQSLLTLPQTLEKEFISVQDSTDCTLGDRDKRDGVLLDI